jgi:hypothetical protein
MANLGSLNFDANTVEPDVGFIPVPAGEYDAVIESSEMKQTKAKTGHYLNVEFKILNGKQQNRKIFEKLNLDNPNEKAVQIAKGTLSAICRAVGIMTPKDSSELHGKPMRITVKVKDGGEFGMQNNIVKYAPRTVPPVAPGGTITVSQLPGESPPAGGVPWEQ